MKLFPKVWRWGLGFRVVVADVVVVAAIVRVWCLGF